MLGYANDSYFSAFRRLLEGESTTEAMHEKVIQRIFIRKVLQNIVL